MTKFQYAPGLPGYGNQGPDGSIGLGGLATYFTPFNGQSGQNSITTRIAANNVLFGIAELLPGYPSRRYQTGDMIIDVTGSAYKIDLDTVNLFTSIGASLSAEPFFAFQANIATTGYERYSNVFGTSRKTVDNVYSIDGGIGYLTWPAEIYIDTATEFPVINFSNVTGLSSASGNEYHPYLLFTSGKTDADAIAIVKNSATNLWRFGNLDAGGSQQTVEMHFDFSDVYVSGDLTVAGGLSGAYTGTLDVTNSTNTTAFLTFTDAATGQQLLRSNAQVVLNATTGVVGSKGFDINADGTAIGGAGAITFGASNDAGIYYHGSNNNLILETATATADIELQSIDDIVLNAKGGTMTVQMNGTASATFTTTGINITSGDNYSIASTNVLNATTLGTGVINSSLTNLGTLTTLQVDNININGNAITSTAGTDLIIKPLAGQQIVLDSTIVIDAGVITGATSITSTTFVGALSGNATTATNATNATNVDVAVTTLSVTRPFIFAADVGPGKIRLYTDSAKTCYINPGTNTIGATTFIGALSGNATTSSSTTGNAATATIATTLTVSNKEGGGTSNGILFRDAITSATIRSDADEFYYSGSICYALDFSALSDERLKKDFTSYGPVLNKIILLHGKFSHFNWIKSGDSDVGYSAQIVDKIFPELVKTNIESKNIKNKMSLKYQKMGGIALEGIAELNSKLESEIKIITTENKILKERLLAIEEKIELFLNK